MKHENSKDKHEKIKKISRVKSLLTESNELLKKKENSWEQITRFINGVIILVGRGDTSWPSTSRCLDKIEF